MIGKSAPKPFKFNGLSVAPGNRAETTMSLGSNPLGWSRQIPVHILHGTRPGPVLAVTAAIHGNELNGIGIIHRLSFGSDHLPGTADDIVNLTELKGTLLLLPVVNIEGFLRGERETPDGRDLNRSFPGSENGSQAHRIADLLFKKVIGRANYLVDIHTAALTRLNVPHIRANLDLEECRLMARSFGTKIVMHSKGIEGTLRKTATEAGVPSILLETGSSSSFQKENIDQGVEGILGLMGGIGMLDKEAVKPSWRVFVRSSRWVRCDTGGLLHLEVKGRTLVKEGDTIALVTDPLGSNVSKVVAPHTGLVVGYSTTPLVRSGDPVAHLVKVAKTLPAIERALAADSDSIETKEEEVVDHEGLSIDEM